MIQYYYAIGPVERHESKEEGVWYGPPTDCVGWIDTRPCENAEGTGFFAFHHRPRHLGVAYTIIGDGKPLDVYFPTLTERSAWETLYGVKVASTDTLLEILVHLLTEQADAEGVERCRPLTLNHLGEYEIHLGGHSRIFRSKFQGEKDRLWPNLQRLWQSELRKTHTAEGKRGADPDVQTGKMLTELARLHRCPAKLLTPKELKGLKPRKPTTRLRDDFNRANGELSVAGNATYGGVDQGWGWERFRGTVVHNIVDGQLVLTQQNTKNPSYRATTPLSSTNHFVQEYVVSAAQSAGAILRKDATATQTFYLAEYDEFQETMVFRKYLDNAVTTLNYTGLNAGVPPLTLKVIADGSTLSSYRDGVPNNQRTDTAIPSGSYTGIGGFHGNGIVDNFVTADLLTSQTPGTLFSEGAL